MVITKRRLANAGLLFLLMAVALGASLLLPKHFRLNDTKVPQQVIAPVACDIEKGPCISRHGDLAVRFAVNGEVIGSYQPLQFYVEVSGLRPDSVTIEFEGVEMFMGINRLVLDENTAGKFSGTLGLPGHAYPMLWRARVLLEKGGSLIDAGFEFELE
jgi:hypothetical protein